MQLNNLIEMSRRYGINEEYVLVGGGNTSYKENGIMYVKGSGTSLADITEEQFVGMDVKKLCDIAHPAYLDDMKNLRESEKEETVLNAIMAAKLPGNETKRPSVEAVLHALFPYKYVLHVHPALFNGLTCGKKGKELCCEQLGHEKAVWIPLIKPGITLALACSVLFNDFFKSYEKYPQLVFLQNHGVFVAADTVAEIDEIMKNVYNKLKESVKEEPDFEIVPFDRKKACEMAPALRMLYSSEGMSVVKFHANKLTQRFVANKNAFEPLIKPFSPDHMVYYNDEPMYIKTDDDLMTAFSDFEKRKGYKPKIVAVQDLGVFALGKNEKEAEQARLLFIDAMKVALYAESFGGALSMTDELIDFISGWEAESYRSKVALSESTKRRLEGRIALVTGGAQGFGKGLAEAMAGEGAYVVVADLNREGAEGVASELNQKHGKNTAIAVGANVTDEKSVENMIEEAVLAFGGLDILLSNAGVLVAGSLADMTEKSFDFVTDVNYKGYFLCAKYASIPMKIQNEYSRGYLTDIIEINSKSGLEGSKKNFAYAGSKFGGIGLTQSFAMELIEYGIKVNAVCPGNLLDGPLWSDPEKGLFRQYLDSGKVPGAKTIEDVRKFYEDKVPMKRGCTIEDVACAIFYIVEQKYETGQAIPITGGQVMLN